jgi:hypothetical protein
VTLTVIVHAPDAGIVPAVTLNVPPPAVAVVATPEQVPPTTSGVVFTNPTGYVSVKFAPVSAVAFGFVKVNVSVVLAPWMICVAPKPFVIVGRPSTSVASLALLLDASNSPVLIETEAALVTLVGPEADTSTVSVIVG